MLTKSDILVGEEGEELVYVQKSLATNKNKYIKKQAILAASTILEAIGHFRTLLDFPSDVRIRVCKLKGNYAGKYHNQSRVAEIDYSYDQKTIVTYLAHELIHAEQYHQKRLEQRWDSKRGWMHYWRGSQSLNKGSTYDRYRAQPWEQEAFSRQEPLAEIVRAEMVKVYNARKFDQ